MGRIGFALRTDFDAAIAEMLEVCAPAGAGDDRPVPALRRGRRRQRRERGLHRGAARSSSSRPTSALKAAGREPPLVHCDNSAGVMLHPDWPARPAPAPAAWPAPASSSTASTPATRSASAAFRPVMKLKTVVSMVKEMQPGQSRQLRPPLHRRKAHQGRHPLHRLRRRLPPSAELRQGHRGDPRQALPGAGPGLHGPDDGGRLRPARRAGGGRSHPVGRHGERQRRDHRPQDRYHFLRGALRRFPPGAPRLSGTRQIMAVEDWNPGS